MKGLVTKRIETVTDATKNANEQMWLDRARRVDSEYVLGIEFSSSLAGEIYKIRRVQNINQLISQNGNSNFNPNINSNVYPNVNPNGNPYVNANIYSNGNTNANLSLNDLYQLQCRRNKYIYQKEIVYRLVNYIEKVDGHNEDALTRIINISYMNPFSHASRQ
ncbi:unnamed protein product [Didymodactylos carnosus]|uniref:Uncharacterized protein n=1 Tax=Didymodactylos carnosus TaxID=1234261 RepID=A0A8S2F737_9BILA|nr:unnamed protein product [Didymodactylos carnosus]CAF4158853.1 unnamed protein product [Didymodactylos carnosus]